MGVFALLLLAGGGVLLYSAYKGQRPDVVITSLLRNEDLPSPSFTFGSNAGEATGDTAGGMLDDYLEWKRKQAPSEGNKSGVKLGSDPKFARPVTGSISSRYGMRVGGYHWGLDIAAPMGTEIRAAAAGTVDMSGWNGGYGNYVRIDHPSDSPHWTTGYGHMSRILVAKGTKVKAGDVIGKVGSTGDSTGPHLHFEVSRNGVKVDPEKYL